MIKNPITVTETALVTLNISYRIINFTNKSLFFCELSNGITFDMFVGRDGSIRLWRFIGITASSKSGMKIEYRKFRYSNVVLGLEVMEEGDLNLYAEQQINFDNAQSAKYVYELIKNFSQIIINYIVKI